MATHLTALGMTDGVGSMLVGAKDQDYEILGNIEWRKYYHSGTWQYNFDNAWMVNTWEEAPSIPDDLDIIMGHPECGQWSNLGFSSMGNTMARYEVPSDIPVFIHGVRKYRPKMFAMDNLVKSLHAVPLTKWAEELPEYDLFVEYVSNYHYGNVQLHRKRMFIIGALKEFGYVFQPGEFSHTKSVWDEIGDLYGKTEYDVPNHVQFPDELQSAAQDYFTGRRMNVAEAAKLFQELPAGRAPAYLAKDGTEKKRIGMMRLYKDKHSHTLTGSNYHMHPITGKPITVRERARIQGFPDSFEFIFKKKTHHYDTNGSRQTGKAMPIQFCTFMTDQFKKTIQNEYYEIKSPRRHLQDPLVDSSKISYCQTIGYSDQSKACSYCSVANCPIRREDTLVEMGQFAPVRQAA